MSFEIFCPVLSLADGFVRFELAEDRRAMRPRSLVVRLDVIHAHVDTVDDERSLQPASRGVTHLGVALRAAVVPSRPTEHHDAVADRQVHMRDAAITREATRLREAERGA